VWKKSPKKEEDTTKESTRNRSLSEGYMFPKLQLKNLLWSPGKKRNRMDEDASRRTQRRQSENVCQACKVISKVQCKTADGKEEKIGLNDADQDAMQLRECESCHRMFEARYAAQFYAIPFV
jgi:hypothetical protein